MPISTGSTTLTTSSLNVNKKGFISRRESKPQRSEGFTLVELLVVISIIAILSGIAAVSYSALMKNSNDTKRQSDIKSFQSYLEQYRADQNYYPTSMNLSTVFEFSSSTGNPAPPSSKKTYLNNTPIDPQNSVSPYLYTALPSGCNNTGTSLCTSYCLYAMLANSTQMTDKCTDKTNSSGKTYTLEVTLP